MKITRRQLRKLITETLGGDDPGADIDKLIKLMIYDFDYGLILAEDLEISHVDIRDRVTRKIGVINTRMSKTGKIPPEFNDLKKLWNKLWKLSRQGKHYSS